jgi:plasmid maintenance system antidote protein VapI
MEVFFMNLENQLQSFKSKVLAKKAIVLALAGAFLVTGIGITQMPQSVAIAATQQVQHQEQHQRPDFNPEVMAQNIQDSFGIDKQVILDYNKQGWKMHDLHKAALIAYASEKPISDILNAKTMTNDWKNVGESFGVTKEKFHTVMQTMMSKKMATTLGVNSDVINSFLSQGYHPRDTAMAVTLSKHTDKTTDEILNMKKINNRWSDVATALGISDEDYNQYQDSVRKCLPGKNHGHHGDGLEFKHRRVNGNMTQMAPNNEPTPQ